jgi:hypothetical protein
VKPCRILYEAASPRRPEQRTPLPQPSQLPAKHQALSEIHGEKFALVVADYLRQPFRLDLTRAYCTSIKTVKKKIFKTFDTSILNSNSGKVNPDKSPQTE